MIALRILSVFATAWVFVCILAATVVAAALAGPVIVLIRLGRMALPRGDA